MSRAIISTSLFSDLVIGSLGVFHPMTSGSAVYLCLIGLFCSTTLLLATVLAEAMEQPEAIGLGQQVRSIHK